MNFKIKMLTPEIIHLTFKNTRQMKRHLMRFQLYAEHPVFRRKIFTQKQYINWFLKTYDKKESEVYSLWDGCNIPHTAFKPFWAGAFKSLSPEEKNVLEALEGLRGRRFYLIAAAEGEKSIFRHELAHALYYTDVKYREKAKAIVQSLGTHVRKVINARLYFADYDKTTLVDETQAYLLEGLKVFDMVFPDDMPRMPKEVEAAFKEKTKDIKALFKKHKKLSDIKISA